MKVRIEYFCKPPKKNSDFEYENIHKDFELPFIPNIGTMIKVEPGGDYVEVRDVHQDISTNDIVISVGLEEPAEYALSSWAKMKAQGWRKE